MTQTSCRGEPGTDKLAADAAPLMRRQDRHRRQGKALNLMARRIADADAREQDMAHDLIVDHGDQGKRGNKSIALSQGIDKYRLVILAESSLVELVDGGLIGRLFLPDRDRPLVFGLHAP
jgi:hypothetical protein